MVPFEKTVIMQPPHADLTDAWLERAANLRHANLSHAKLTDVNFIGSYIVDAQLTNADLRGTKLTHADLNGAVVTNNQLAQALTLVGATMPDGTKMTERRWQEFKRQHSRSE